MTSCIDTIYDSLVFLGYKGDPADLKWKATQGLSLITGIVLLIIGCVAAAGAFPGASLPWVTVGLAGGGFLLTLAYGKFSDRKFELISRALMAAAFITIGALGGAGILSTAGVAYGIIGTTLALIPMAGINWAYEKRRQKFQYVHVT